MKNYADFHASAQPELSNSPENFFSELIDPAEITGPRGAPPPRRSLSQILREALNLALHRIRCANASAAIDARRGALQIAAKSTVRKVWARKPQSRKPKPIAKTAAKKASSPKPATKTATQRFRPPSPAALEAQHAAALKLWRARLPKSDAETIEKIAIGFGTDDQSPTVDCYLPHSHGALWPAARQANRDHGWDGAETGFVFRSRETINDGDWSWFTFRGEFACAS